MSKYILTDTLYYRPIMIGYIDFQGMNFADICHQVWTVLNDDRKGIVLGLSTQVVLTAAFLEICSPVLVSYVYLAFLSLTWAVWVSLSTI